MQKTYTPKADAAYAGTVTLREPNFEEQCDLQEAVMAARESGSGTVANIRAMKALVMATRPFYVAVALKHKKTGDEVTSFEAMAERRDAFPVLSHIAEGVLSGFDDEGNDSAPSVA